MPLRLRPDTATTDTDDGLVLLDECTGGYWQLNPTGADVLHALLAGHDLPSASPRIWPPTIVLTFSKSSATSPPLPSSCTQRSLWSHERPHRSGTSASAPSTPSRSAFARRRCRPATDHLTSPATAPRTGIRPSRRPARHRAASPHRPPSGGRSEPALRWQRLLATLHRRRPTLPRQGSWPTWCTGVRTNPFTAHAWIQVADQPIGELHPAGHYRALITIPLATSHLDRLPGFFQRKNNDLPCQCRPEGRLG